MDNQSTTSVRAKNPAAVALGKLGGQKTGPTKARSKEHYENMAQLALAARGVKPKQNNPKKELTASG